MNVNPAPDPSDPAAGAGGAPVLSRPPLGLRRRVLRVLVLVVAVWGSPATIVSSMAVALRYGFAGAALEYAAFLGACFWAGRIVGRFERDKPAEFGLGCAWAYYLFGSLNIMLAWDHGGLRGGLVLIALGIGANLVGYWPAKRSSERRMRNLAAGRCLFCEYDLRGLTTGVCPECGQRAIGAPDAAGAESGHA